VLYRQVCSPKSEAELLSRAKTIEGMTFAQLAVMLNVSIPSEPNQRKGWVGQAIELLLGTTASNQSLPDFTELGIELKTIPLSIRGTVAESTFIVTIPLLTIHKQQWITSQCYAKLKRVLWIMIESDKEIPFNQRRVGRGVLWSPDQEQLKILSKDWNHLTSLIVTGQLESLNASMGNYLQIRPKAANGKSLTYYFDTEGNKTQTLPRGFYLRPSFTKHILTTSN
jgi:DNA mismatch repair protein MutH